jgi:hypothetical protein
VKIAVVVNDMGAALHMGADVQVTVRVFDVPDDMARYVEKANGSGESTVTFALVDEEVQS